LLLVERHALHSVKKRNVNSQTPSGDSHLQET